MSRSSFSRRTRFLSPFCGQKSPTLPKTGVANPHGIYRQHIHNCNESVCVCSLRYTFQHKSQLSVCVGQNGSRLSFRVGQREILGVSFLTDQAFSVKLNLDFDSSSSMYACQEENDFEDSSATSNYAQRNFAPVPLCVRSVTVPL